MMFNLIHSAYADATPVVASQTGFDVKGLVPIALFLLVMYFFLMRPQQKKLKQHADMISTLRRGDKVIVASGIIGLVHKVISPEELIVELSENVRIRVLKSSVTQVLAKTSPVAVTTEGDESMIESMVDNTIDSVKSEFVEPVAKVKKVVQTAVHNNQKSSKNSASRSQVQTNNGHDGGQKNKKNKEKL